jgi:hypothetical protein
VSQNLDPAQVLDIPFEHERIEVLHFESTQKLSSTVEHLRIMSAKFEPILDKLALGAIVLENCYSHAPLIFVVLIRPRLIFVCTLRDTCIVSVI